jgi:IPT/TIG domain
MKAAEMKIHVLAASAAVSPGSRWVAVLIGLAVLVLLYLVTAVTSGQWNPWKFVEGADGWASTSKLQWFLWIVVILFAYTALWVLRADQGHYSAISQVPVNLLTVLAFSTGTAAAAKGITSAYVQSNRVSKPSRAAAPAGAPGGAAAPAGPKPGILNDDSGVPELAKIQVMGFTLVAIGIYLATVIHQIVSHPVITSLPNIDTSLLVLMGISQGGYLGKKLVTFGSPALYTADPPTAAAGAPVALKGANLGASPAGSLLTLDGAQIPFTRWSDSTIVFNLPPSEPVTNTAWTPSQQVQFAVVVSGQTSNAITFTVT